MINPEMELAAHPEFQRKSPIAEGLLGFRRAASGTRTSSASEWTPSPPVCHPGKGEPISRINPEKLRETMVNNGGLYRAIQRKPNPQPRRYPGRNRRRAAGSALV